MSTTIILAAGGAVSALILILTVIFFLRGHGRRTPPYQRPPLGLLTRCLVRLSGHHPREFEGVDRSVAWRFASCGTSVFVPATVAFFGILLACNLFDVGGGLGLAAAGGAFVLLLDFILVATLGGSRNDKTGRVLVIYRVCLAVAIAWFTGRPLILSIYGSAIDAANRSNRWEEIRQTIEQREALKHAAMGADQPLVERFAVQRKELQEKLKALAPVRERMNLAIIENEKAREDEDLRGRDGRKPGRGDFYTREMEYLDQKKKELAKLEAEEARITGELEALAKNQEAQLEKANSDAALQALGNAAGKHIQDLTNHKPGWSEREDLMLKWLVERPIVRFPGFAAIHIGLLLLDLLPLLTLLGVRREELAKARRIRDAQMNAEAEVAEKIATESAHETVLERQTRDRFRERSATVKEIGDLRWEFAIHQMLRGEQAEAAARPAFFKIRFRTTKPTPEQEAAWEKASQPLRRARDKNLGDFENLMR